MAIISNVSEAKPTEGVRGSSPGKLNRKQTAFGCLFSSTLSGARTLDPLIKSQLLYQLS